jgi:hypothetical protein
MKERKIYIFGLSKTKWMGQGRKKLRDGYEIIWSGEVTQKRNMAAINVSPTYAEMVIDSECTSGRMIKIKILMKEKEINIWQT